MNGERAPRAQPGDWFVVARLEEYDGEMRANVLRIAAVTLFYLIELVNYRGLHLGVVDMPRVEGVDARFHMAMTALSVAWIATAAGVIVALRGRFFPPALKYVTTAADAALLTAVLTIADGPRSTLVVGYFLVIALSGLRLSVGLTRFATAASVAGYVFVLGDARFHREALRVARYQQITVILALVLAGVILGHVVQRARGAAESYARRLPPPPPDDGARAE